MNTKVTGQHLGMALTSVGMGGYLLVLELVRLVNYFAAELYALTPVIYLVSCFVCSVLITVGVFRSTRMVQRVGIVATSILGIVGLCIICVILIYFAYVVPYFQHEHLELIDWVLICSICLVGIMLVVWGANHLVRES